MIEFLKKNAHSFSICDHMFLSSHSSDMRIGASIVQLRLRSAFWRAMTAHVHLKVKNAKIAKWLHTDVYKRIHRGICQIEVGDPEYRGVQDSLLIYELRCELENC